MIVVRLKHKALSISYERVVLDGIKKSQGGDEKARVYASVNRVEYRQPWQKR